MRARFDIWGVLGITATVVAAILSCLLALSLLVDSYSYVRRLPLECFLVRDNFGLPCYVIPQIAEQPTPPQVAEQPGYAHPMAKALQGTLTRTVNMIIVHHSGVVVDQSLSDYSSQIEAMRRYHKSLGWDDIGYHYIIDPSGAWHQGRALDKIGAHCKRYNIGSVGVCLLGNFEMQEPTKEQMRALRDLVVFLQKRCEKPLIIKGHNAFAATLCPGKNLTKELVLEYKE